MKFESYLHVQTSGLESAEQANEMNAALSAVLMAVYEMPGFLGDMTIGAEVKTYDPATAAYDDGGLREAAERVVAEIKADMDPDRDSDYNMAPYPDPVGALVALAEKIVREVA